MTNKTIYKYTLEVRDIQTIELPKKSQILCVQVQNNEPNIWVLINDKGAELEQVKIRTIGTGHTIAEDNVIFDNYIGTYQLHNGGFVAHLFVIK